MPEGITLELEKPADPISTAEAGVGSQSADRPKVKTNDYPKPAKTAEDILEKLKADARKKEAEKLSELLDEAKSNS